MIVIPDLFLSSYVPSGDPFLDRYLAEQCLRANGALLDLSEGLIEPVEFLGVLEVTGHDMDSTIEIFEENLFYAGLT